MADISVSDFLSLINEQIQEKENLNACLSKLEALIMLATSSDFTELTQLTIHGCLWIVNDYIQQAIKLNRESIDNLLTQQGILKPG